MSKIYATLGRKFSKKDLEEAQRMGEDIVSLDLLFQPIFRTYSEVLVYFECIL